VNLHGKSKEHCFLESVNMETDVKLLTYLLTYLQSYSMVHDI
jgi:hypothetical protein